RDVFINGITATLRVMPSAPTTRPEALELQAVRLLEVERKKQKVSMRGAAPAVGVSHSFLSRVFAGEKPLTLTQFERLCVLLGRDPVDVLAKAQKRINL